MDKLDNAIEQITIEMLEGLTYGSEVELNDEYTLYHYIEDDIISIFNTEEWVEMYAVLYSKETNEIIIEEL